MRKLVLFFTITLSLAAFAKVGAEKPDCRGLLSTVGEVRVQANEDLRQDFINEFAELIFATEAENQIWIDDALNSKDPADIHVLVENWGTKKLNDKVLKNKDFVTALTNFHKKIFLEELNKRSIVLKHDAYQDFKSTRLTLRGPVDTKTLSQLEEAFTSTNQIFYASPRLKSILREEDMRENWFRMGLGQTEIQAALAARDARDFGGVRGISYFWDPKVSDRFTAQLKNVQYLHGVILTRLNDTDLLVRERDGLFLSVDVFAAARKATREDFLLTLKQMFPHVSLDQTIAENILRYAGIVDEFSPSVLVAKRELLTIHDAPFGAISLDFIGLGAENLRGTAKALTKAKDLTQAVRLTRAFEREVTILFEKRKEMVRASTLEYFQDQVSLRFSGDDGIIIPEREVTLRDQLFLMQKLSQLLSKPYFRMAVINAEGAAAAESSQLITHGESIEKTLRQILLKKIGGERLNEISLQTFIPETGNYRTVFLVLAAKKNLAPKERRAILNAFPTAVKVVEAQVQAQGLKVEYKPSEIFAIFGKKRLD